MVIFYNKIFRQLLNQYKIADDFSFYIELPAEVKAIINDRILISDRGITLNLFNKLYKPIQEWENKSIIEDETNHFHVDWFIKPPDNKRCFMLGIKTLVLLAEKFRIEKITGIRFWFSFQTPELGQLQDEQNQIHEIGDEYYISDRLSFYNDELMKK